MSEGLPPKSSEQSAGEVGGIPMADPPLRAGWLWTAAAGVAFAIGLWFWHQIAETPGTLDRYLVERAAALDTGALLSEDMLHELAEDSLAVRTGKRAFSKHCTTCHGEHAEGDEGPSLVDNEWIDESSALDIYTTVVEGRDAEGMPPWGSLGRGLCMQITAYLLTLREDGGPEEAAEAQK